MCVTCYNSTIYHCTIYVYIYIHTARAWDPADSDVQEVLGVLFNVSSDYDSAVEAFRVAINSKPESYALWNKLGATLANGDKCTEALSAYERSLSIKPRYARGWLNVGISHAGLGQYMESAAAYLQVQPLSLSLLFSSLVTKCNHSYCPVSPLTTSSLIPSFLLLYTRPWH